MKMYLILINLSSDIKGENLCYLHRLNKYFLKYIDKLPGVKNVHHHNCLSRMDKKKHLKCNKGIQTVDIFKRYIT